MKGLIVDIYKPADGSDCTNGGVTSKAKDALLVGPGIDEVFEDHGERPVFKIIRRRILSSCPGCGDNAPGEKWIHLSAVPADLPAGKQLAFGGNFIWSCDGRFRAISEYPIPVHDHDIAARPIRRSIDEIAGIDQLPAYSTGMMPRNEEGRAA